MIKSTYSIPPRKFYEQAFELERKNVYPFIDAFEEVCGFAIDKDWLERAAKVLACPVKKKPPSWQHGRVLYAIARRMLDNEPAAPRQFWVDIGTAKGFSAAVMCKAMGDAGFVGAVNSIDVVDPKARVPRNSIEDTTGAEFKTVQELVEPFLRASATVHFIGMSSHDWFKSLPKNLRINLAFVDGKHTAEAVLRDAKSIIKRQQLGDVIVFDDLQIPNVESAIDVAPLESYVVTKHWSKEDRGYAVACRLQ